jgi:hypothetical protein
VHNQNRLPNSCQPGRERLCSKGPRSHALTAVRSLERQFKGFTLHHVDRAKNEEADALAKAAARGKALPSDVFYHIIGTPAVRSPEDLQITNDTEGHRIVNLIMTED